MAEPGASELRAVLDDARRLGLLGPGAVDLQLSHSQRFGALLAPDEVPERFLDLGSGGGLPGLALVCAWPGVEATLLDASNRRAAFLDEARDRLRVTDRVSVVASRAEEAARRPELRGRFDLVTARSFGRPAVTAECAVGFLRAGGRLAVSEPPEPDPQRWPADGLASLGFAPVQIRRGEGTSMALALLPGGPDDRWPRRTGIPAKRPLWK